MPLTMTSAEFEFSQSIQKFTLDTLRAFSIPKRRRRLDRNTPKGPLWSVDIPESKSLVPAILDFARTQRVKLSANGANLAVWEIPYQPLAMASGLQ